MQPQSLRVLAVEIVYISKKYFQQQYGSISCDFNIKNFLLILSKFLKMTYKIENPLCKSVLCGHLLKVMYEQRSFNELYFCYL